MINALKLSAEIIHAAIERFNRGNAALTRKLTDFCQLLARGWHLSGLFPAPFSADQRSFHPVSPRHGGLSLATKPFLSSGGCGQPEVVQSGSNRISAKGKDERCHSDENRRRPKSKVGTA